MNDPFYIIKGQSNHRIRSNFAEQELQQGDIIVTNYVERSLLFDDINRSYLFFLW